MISTPEKPAGLLGAGFAALRRFYRPFLLIQLAAGAIVVAYTRSEAVRAVCRGLAALKVAGGLGFAAASASLAGGLLPEIAKVLAIGPRRAFVELKGRGGELLFNLAFFAFNGVVIDFLYRAEARWFGVDATLGTVACKVAFDQFVFTPLWLPVIIALYQWRGVGFSTAATIARLREPGFYRRRVVPLLVPDWCFWIPMVSVIYALPGPLQFILFVFALGAWSLIMVFIASDGVASDTVKQP